MSLDVYLEAVQPCEVYWRNITHNLGAMARAAGVYRELWRPDEIGITTAGQLIEPLRRGVQWLKDNPDEARKHNPPNGWGDYEGLLLFCQSYLQACEDNPEASVRVSR